MKNSRENPVAHIRYDRVLYVSSDVDSKKAEEVLREAHVDYQRIFISDPHKEGCIVPQPLTKEGFFEGINKIDWYARVYGSKK